MGDLLRTIRVFSSGLRVMGRYKSARWITFVVAIGLMVWGFAK